MKTKKVLIPLGIIVIVLVFIFVSFNKGKPESEATNVPQDLNREINLADLAQSSSKYDGQTITTTGIIIGVQANVVSQSQIEEDDHTANIVDGNNEILLSIGNNAAIDQAATGDIIRVTGIFNYAAPAENDAPLSHSAITVLTPGSVSVIGKSTTNIISPKEVTTKIMSILSSSSQEIKKAITEVDSSTSFVKCMNEYKIIWNELCAAGSLPNNCNAMYYNDSVKELNTSFEALSKSCYERFNTMDKNTVNTVFKMMFDLSNTSGSTLISQLEPSAH